jgi:hypothetical protein
VLLLDEADGLGDEAVVPCVVQGVVHGGACSGRAVPVRFASCTRSLVNIGISAGRAFGP